MKKRTNVLIAEDDKFLADVMQKTLKLHGIRAAIARDGQQAMEMIAKEKPSLLLLDILMPNVDGFGVIEYIRSNKFSFPVIVMSNLSDPKSKERCKQLGVDCYFVKSDMDDEQLWPALSKYLPRGLIAARAAARSSGGS